MPALKEAKSERIEVRLTPATKHILQEAATATHRDLSDFVLQSSLAEAEIALSRRTLFVLEDAQWDKFVEILDRPTTEIPALRRLLTRPSALER
jgi:uncharacterized protein (DUF1778 family)